MKTLSRVYMWLIFALLYAPILVLVIFSFNRSGDINSYSQFSFYWYGELFKDAKAFESLKNSLFLAITSSLLATLIGTLAAFGIDRMRNKYLRSTIMSVTNIPMMNPDIVTGVSFMLFFAAVVSIFKIEDYGAIGFPAMLIAHVTFCLPYVILNVLPRINELGNSLSEAALDLGCTPVQAFFKVKLPNIMPGVISGAVMAFTLSLDDFVISYFVSPTDFQTLPLHIYSMTKKTVKPDMYALSTLIIVTVFTLLIISNIRSARKTDSRVRKGGKK